MIDDNGGIDFSVETLKKWKSDHEIWVRNNLNKSINPDQKGQTINVNSYNQSGGITAGIVNFAPQGRKIDRAFENELDNTFTNPSEKILISAQMSDHEANDFAEEIRKYLNLKGFKISEVGQFMQMPQVIGQELFTERDGTRHIKIGRKKQ